MDDIRARLQDTPFAVSNVKRTDKRRSPSPPFTTSTMQQEASRKLNMTPRRTMAIAQQLYEGRGHQRRGHRGSDHLYAYRLPAYLRRGTGSGPQASLKAATARPIARKPPAVQGQGRGPGRPRGHPPQQRHPDPGAGERGDLTGEQYRLYRLIWSRFLASQMSNAVYDSVSVDIAAGGARLPGQRQQP